MVGHGARSVPRRTGLQVSGRLRVKAGIPGTPHRPVRHHLQAVGFGSRAAFSQGPRTRDRMDTVLPTRTRPGAVANITATTGSTARRSDALNPWRTSL